MEPDRLQEQLDQREEDATDAERILWAIQSLEATVKKGFDDIIYAIESKDHPYKGLAAAVANDPLNLKHNPDLLGQGSKR